MDNDWRTKAVEDFCRENNVVVAVEDEWRTLEKKVVMKKGKRSVVRRIPNDTLYCLIPTGLLNEMINEIPAEETGK